MKYTKKQIEKAYLKWETELRLNPSAFMNNEEAFSYDAAEMAKRHATALIKYIED